MEILVEGQLDYFEERSWKKRYFVMKYEISSGLRYIEIYKDKNWQKQLPRHVVNLHPGYEVRPREEPKKKHCFSVKTTDHTLLLASEDDSIITLWKSKLEGYNLVKSFCVQPQETPTMVRIEAIFPCHLQLVSSEVRLVSAMDGKLLGLWPFKCIRRYKFIGNLFSIEAGRKAPTGEGVFEFISNECSEIYRVMDTIIRTKAGNTSVRRLASEKIHNQIEQGHQPIRKTLSVPPIPTSNPKEVHYDYAAPVVTTPLSRPPPHVPLPSPPKLPYTELDTTYDTCAPVNNGPLDYFDAKFCQPGATPTNENDYNTLQFDTPPQRAPKMAGSPGSYDSLRFESVSSHSTLNELEAKVGDYDTLQFGAKMEKRENLSSSMDDISPTENRCKESDRPQSAASFYDTLDRSSGSFGSVTGMPSDTYDSLDVGGKSPPSGGPDTYDCLDNTGQVKRPTNIDLHTDSTYDALQHDKQKPAGRYSSGQGVTPQKPTAPVRRKKPTSKPPEPVARSIPAANKPVKPVRKHETREDQKAKPENMSDVIQKRLAMPPPPPPEDDGNYASVDNDYTSIDYSKVSTKSDPTPSSDIYAEPDDALVRVTPIPKPSTKPPKPMKNPPKPGRHPFGKKAPLSPKPKVDAEGNFADELKKKLQIKLKKSGGGHKPPSQTGHSGHDDAIYDEVDSTLRKVDATYSEPFDPNEANV